MTLTMILGASLCTATVFSVVAWFVNFELIDHALDRRYRRRIQAWKIVEHVCNVITVVLLIASIWAFAASVIAL